MLPDSRHLSRFALFLVIVFHLLSSSAQNILADMDHDAQRTYDRMTVLSGGGPLTLHASLQPFWRKDLVALVDSFARVAQDPIDWSLVQSIWDQNNEFTRTDSGDSLSMLLGKVIPAVRYRQSSRPLWHTFYKTPAHFYEVDVPDFYLRIDPLIRVGAGRETEEGVTTFINQRGLSLRGGISNSVFFQTTIFDSQIRFPNYINRFTDIYGVVPGAGLFKAFSSKIFNSAGGRDFLLANAYVGF
ncbi:MAG TPA: hypothetical protein VJ508_11560, partial [Saprospiraceae bacterium]|nr:hypothetical protein [Saprospiraceae bacterium]